MYAYISRLNCWINKADWLSSCWLLKKDNVGWLRNYVTIRKVEDSSSDEVTEFLSMHLSFQMYHGLLTDSASSRNDYKKCFWREERGRRIRLTTSPPSVS
jgi:hypothetical protein